MKKDELAMILTRVGNVLNKKVDPGLIDSYNFVLGNQSRFRVLRSCMLIMQSATWFPKPNEIINQIRNDTSMMPSNFDEACHWIMFARGITDPGELTEREISQINEKYGLVDSYVK